MVDNLAILYSNNNIFSSKGEEYLYNHILMSLTDDWHIFHEPIILGKKPDFVIYHPNYGITIIEVKDYDENSISEMNSKFWKVKTNGMSKTLTSPHEQAIRYRNNLISLLSKDKDLLSLNKNYKGKLKVPISIICCFPNISKNNKIYKMISNLIIEDMLIVKEELTSTDIFIKKIIKSFERLFRPENISKEQNDKIIHCIFPHFVLENLNEPIITPNINQLFEMLPHEKFDNYVEELIYVSDLVSHWLNTDINEKIAIVYNKTRSVSPNSVEYINFLLQLLR